MNEIASVKWPVALIGRKVVNGVTIWSNRVVVLSSEDAWKKFGDDVCMRMGGCPRYEYSDELGFISGEVSETYEQWEAASFTGFDNDGGIDGSGPAPDVRDGTCSPGADCASMY